MWLGASETGLPSQFGDEYLARPTRSAATSRWPHRLYRPTQVLVVAQVECLRRRRYTGRQIAAELGVSPATVSRILKRLGLNRLRALEPAEPVRRYERARPGELIHIDIKKLGRIDGVGHRITGDRHRQSNRRSRGEGLGWEFVHVAIDDNSRIAFAKVMPDEKKGSAVAFLEAALAYYQRLGLRHLRTRPYTPKTNGKAARFIQTCLREWAYAQAYHHSRQRTGELPFWLHRYNWHRPHAGIGAKKTSADSP